MDNVVRLVPQAVDSDAIAIGNLYRRAKESVISGVRYAIEAGQRLTEKKTALKKLTPRRGNWLMWLKANADMLGFDTAQTAQRLMRVAARYVVDDVSDEAIAVQISLELWGNVGRGAKPYRRGWEGNEWATPKEYIDRAKAVLGRIDLDPASNDLAQGYVGATQHWTKADDPLARPWHGRVWLNPPYYPTSLLSRFVDKLVGEVAIGNTIAAIMLVNNFTDTAWFQTAAAHCRVACFPRRRICFEGAVGEPLNGQTFFYYGDDIDSFCSVFSTIGWLATPFH